MPETEPISIWIVSPLGASDVGSVLGVSDVGSAAGVFVGSAAGVPTVTEAPLNVGLRTIGFLSPSSVTIRFPRAPPSATASKGSE